jgi:hypothetical protein
MTKLPSFSSSVIKLVDTIILLLVSTTPKTHALGFGSTLAVMSASSIVCGIVASQPTQRIECYQPSSQTQNKTIPINPNTNFTAISGSRNFLFGLRSDGYNLLCWDSNFNSRHLYFNVTALIENFSVGDDQVCATFNGICLVYCWRGNNNNNNSKSSNLKKFI